MALIQLYIGSTHITYLHSVKVMGVRGAATKL